MRIIIVAQKIQSALWNLRKWAIWIWERIKMIDLIINRFSIIVIIFSLIIVAILAMVPPNNAMVPPNKLNIIFGYITLFGTITGLYAICLYGKDKWSYIGEIYEIKKEEMREFVEQSGNILRVGESERSIDMQDVLKFIDVSEKADGDILINKNYKEELKNKTMLWVDLINNNKNLLDPFFHNARFSSPFRLYTREYELWRRIIELNPEHNLPVYEGITMQQMDVILDQFRIMYLDDETERQRLEEFTQRYRQFRQEIRQLIYRERDHVNYDSNWKYKELEKLV